MNDEMNLIATVNTTDPTTEKVNVAPPKNTNPDTKASFSEQFLEDVFHVLFYHWNEVAKLSDPDYEKSEIISLSGYSRFVNGKNVTTQVMIDGVHELTLRTSCTLNTEEAMEFSMSCIKDGVEIGLVQMKNGVPVAGAKIVPLLTLNSGHIPLNSSEKEKIKSYIPQTIYKKCALKNEEISIGKFTCNCNPGGLTLHLTGTAREIIGILVLPKTFTQDNSQYRITAIASKAFQETMITSLYLSKYVTVIGERAFAKCMDLQFVEITKKVSEIGKEAFLDCPLKMIYSLNPTPPKMNGNTFGNLDFDNCVLVIPEKSIEAYAIANEWNKFKIVRPSKKTISSK